MNWLPIPVDTITGMYHPWRDLFGNLPFKNFILTDPVRQQYPWRELVIESLRNWQLPLWNPYNFAGTPLLANIQSAVFYPLNFLFFIFSSPVAWSIYIYSSLVLGFVFMYLYLRNLCLSRVAAIFGSLCFILSGFYVAWLENGVLTHTLMWLPAILWSIDKKKLFSFLLFTLFSFFAGHWQTFFYVFVFSHLYLLLKKQFGFLLFTFLFLLLSLLQLIPSLQFIDLSARAADQQWMTNPGWFIPWQNLVQFVSPDYLGNPSTLNYTGVFSYQEFIGYVGILGLIFALSALFIRRKIVYFLFGFLVLLLSFASPTPWAKFPYIFNFPMVSTAMPTRLLSLIDFCLAVLAAFGLNHFVISKYRNKWGYLLLAPLLVFLWILGPNKQLIIPTVIYFVFWVLIFPSQKFKPLVWLFVVLLIVDQGRFALKFLPFGNQAQLFPDTKLTKFLQQNSADGQWRFMTLNDEIFPPNFNVVYRLQSVNGYDPLYLRSYHQLVGGGNRIIVPKDYKNPIFNALGVKYILSFEDLPGYKLVFQEGKTKVFENPFVLPRVSGNSKIVSYQPNRVVISTFSTFSTVLTLSDMYYPGWKVYIDGALTKITPTEYNFRSVTVPAGEHEVVFSYYLF